MLLFGRRMSKQASERANEQVWWELLKSMFDFQQNLVNLMCSYLLLLSLSLLIYLQVVVNKQLEIFLIYDGLASASLHDEMMMVVVVVVVVVMMMVVVVVIQSYPSRSVE